MKSIEEIKRDNAPKKSKGTKATGVPGRARSKRVRGATRGKSTAASARRYVRSHLRGLDEQAFASYGFTPAETTKFPPPCMAFHFGLVGHGYEMRLFENGKYVGTNTRDFSGDHKVADLKLSLAKAIAEAVNAWRAKL